MECNRFAIRTVDRCDHDVAQIALRMCVQVSVEGSPIKMERLKDKIRLQLPLDWTDIILLKF